MVEYWTNSDQKKLKRTKKETSRKWRKKVRGGADSFKLWTLLRITYATIQTYLLYMYVSSVQNDKNFNITDILI